MEKIVIVIDNLPTHVYQPVLDDIVENGDTPVVHHVSRNYFPVSYDSKFARYLSDLDEVLRRGGYSTPKKGLSIVGTGAVDAYAVLASQIQGDHPEIDFYKIDRVVYSREDTSWADVQFSMTFFGHPQWDLYVESA